MATVNVIQESRASKPEPALGNAARTGVVLMAVSAVVGLGRLFDIGVLWIVQRSNTPQWEFMALSNTLDVVPGFVLALGIAYCGLQFKNPQSSVGYRLLAVGLILLGLVSAAVAGLIGMDYLALSKYADPRALGVLRSTALRAVVLGTFFFLVLIPVGIYAFKRPRHARSS